MKAYQVLYTHRTETEAMQVYSGWALQEGFIGGRVYERRTRDGRVEWVFQGFFPCDDSVPFGPTECEGFTVVALLDGMLKTIKEFAGHLVMRHTSIIMDGQEADEYISEIAKVEGFIGARYVAAGDGVRIESYYQGPGFDVQHGFVPVKEIGFDLIRKHTEQVSVPIGMSWYEYASRIQNPAKRAAVMDYLNTWAIVPDKITVTYFA